MKIKTEKKILNKLIEISNKMIEVGLFSKEAHKLEKKERCLRKLLVWESLDKLLESTE